MFPNNMYVPKSPYCHGVFGFSDLLDNLVPIKKNMVKKNQQTVFRKKRKKFFIGVKKQDSCQKKVWSTTVSELDTFTPCSPAKKNCSLDKINGNYSLEETKHSGVHARRMRLELGQG